MHVGMVGLGRMGMNMALRLLRGGHRVVAYNRTYAKVLEIARRGATGAHSLEELVGKLKPPRLVWIMLPAGRPVDEAIDALREVLGPGDTIIDGGNSFYKDDIRRFEGLKGSGIRYVDVGVSGGVWGLRYGYCLMVGGSRRDYLTIRPVLRTLAPRDGFLYCGGPGAGHFVKMVHNGIEYGMMAAYSEGFQILKQSPFGEGFDLAKVAGLWNRGSVVRSWLLELAEAAFRRDSDLSSVGGFVEDSGEGRWTVQQAVESAVPAPVITAALFQRFRSRMDDPLGDRILAALRREFGGHAVREGEPRRKTKALKTGRGARHG